MNTKEETTMTQPVNSSVQWSSSEPFDVPAYATGEWGDYVADIRGPRFTSNLDEAIALTPEQQKRLAHRVNRFYEAKAYRNLMDSVNTARGWF